MMVDGRTINTLLLCRAGGGLLFGLKVPRWVLDLAERAGQVVQETNPTNEDQRLTKYCA